MGVLALVRIVANKRNQVWIERVRDFHRMPDEIDADEWTMMEVGDHGHSLSDERIGQVPDGHALPRHAQMSGFPETITDTESRCSRLAPGLIAPARLAKNFRREIIPDPSHRYTDMRWHHIPIIIFGRHIRKPFSWEDELSSGILNLERSRVKRQDS